MRAFHRAWSLSAAACKGGSGQLPWPPSPARQWPESQAVASSTSWMIQSLPRPIESHRGAHLHRPFLNHQAPPTHAKRLNAASIKTVFQWGKRFKKSAVNSNSADCLRGASARTPWIIRCREAAQAPPDRRRRHLPLTAASAAPAGLGGARSAGSHSVGADQGRDRSCLGLSKARAMGNRLLALRHGRSCAREQRRWPGAAMAGWTTGQRQRQAQTSQVSSGMAPPR